MVNSHLDRFDFTLYARSFRSRFFAYHHAVNHPHTNIILSRLKIKHSFIPKMCRKNFENRFTNKKLMSKLFLNRDFA